MPDKKRTAPLGVHSFLRLGVHWRPLGPCADRRADASQLPNDLDASRRASSLDTPASRNKRSSRSASALRWFDRWIQREIVATMRPILVRTSAPVSRLP